jgi:hypothetical protein
LKFSQRKIVKDTLNTIQNSIHISTEALKEGFLKCINILLSFEIKATRVIERFGIPQRKKNRALWKDAVFG